MWMFTAQAGKGSASIEGAPGTAKGPLLPPPNVASGPIVPAPQTPAHGKSAGPRP